MSRIAGPLHDAAAPSRPLWRCDDCGTVSTWEQGWTWYGSYKDLDDGRKVPTYCPACTAKRTS